MASSKEATEPPVEYADDKKDPDHYLRLVVDIPGLKKKFMQKTAANADITLKLEPRSLCLDVSVESNGSTKVFQYKIKLLPEEISTDEKKTFYKVHKDGEIVVKLHKVVPGRWAAKLASMGLETEEEDGAGDAN